ncbi:exodeoxyribonuclease I [Flocculibacter collagenilyticus]|uniref:exodeoxyribonuclease I n=1 Tax=Flocculibacter collagenilyticus TaxID=2744479 RepID=UPI0018F2B8D0|nr:exodeoxyribonuclease I [Flocculibacter collagenilyticus]
MNNSTNTIFWHDYETWGAVPKKDRPAQFAGIRTDYDLNIIEEPFEVYCQLADDYLPHPQAALITGITPQTVMKRGYTEYDFITRINEQFSRPNTTVAGYNSIRFDDEVTRYTLYRNFYDPYAREWQNGNSRWDIIDLVRACYALRPEGINWPTHEDGKPSFKLEDLTKANGIGHEAAHDAVSDVIATIEMAKLIKQKQAKLYDYIFNLRLKKSVAQLIDVAGMTPLVHVSGMLPSEQGCTTWVVPIGFHPENKNAIIVYNLQSDPAPLQHLTAQEIKEKLYTATADLDPNEERIGLKLVHLNKCPILAPAKTLLPENAERLNIDREQCLKHLDILKNMQGLQQKVEAVFAPNEVDRKIETNPDYALYQGGFVSNGDKQRFQLIHNTKPENLAALDLAFDDKKFSELFFRFRARNFPHTLDNSEMMRWQHYRKDKLMSGHDNPNLTSEDFIIELENLAMEHQEDEHKMNILKALYEYSTQL